MKMERDIRANERHRAPDPDFKISAVHRFIIKFAKERNNVYSLKAYRSMCVPMCRTEKLRTMPYGGIERPLARWFMRAILSIRVGVNIN